MASMRNWLCGSGGDNARVVVVHCKAGKGRSGTAACSYLISEKGWKAADALKQFTERRMRVGFGAGVSIPSQLRWVGYVDRWTNEYDKTYVERPVEIVEVHIWNLKRGVKIDVEGFVDEGRKIKRFHRFHRNEKFPQGSEASSLRSSTNRKEDSDAEKTEDNRDEAPSSATSSSNSLSFQDVSGPEPLSKTIESAVMNSSPDSGGAVVLRPRKKVILPTSDVNIDLERRAMAPYNGWTMVTSIGHVWFNAYFEGGRDHDSGVFEAEWDSLDGIKGTSSKGTRALDRLKVVWRYHTPAVTPEEEAGKKPSIEVPARQPSVGQVIPEPGPGEEVPEGHAADWRGHNVVQAGEEQSPCDTEEQNTSLPNDQNTESTEPESSKPRGSTPRPTSGTASSWGPLSETANKLGLRRSSSPVAAESLVNASGDVTIGSEGNEVQNPESSANSKATKPKKKESR